jgi:3-dehydroquinate synthetase
MEDLAASFPSVVPLALRHGRGTTRLLLGEGALAAAAAPLREWLEGRRAFLLTTPRVWALHGGSLEPLLAPAAAVHRLEVAEGEAAKSLAEAGRLWSAMLGAGGKRDSRLLAFGGGSVGDLGGFVAGAFLRGIGCAQLPTTLLAQVDAAIGGKTAIDLPEAKNSVGLFHHPDLVVAEPAWLRTLPPRELRAGLVEAVKVAFALDAALFARIEAALPALLAAEPAALAAVTAAAATLKVGVVEADPEEAGVRAVLNFGHSLGHALETAAGYRGLLHGEAVAWGMRFALRLAVPRGLAPEDAARLDRVLAAVVPAALPPVEPVELLTLLGRDKKAREGGLGWVLPVAVGETRWGVRVPEPEVEEQLARFLGAGRGAG